MLMPNKMEFRETTEERLDSRRTNFKKVDWKDEFVFKRRLYAVELRKSKRFEKWMTFKQANKINLNSLTSKNSSPLNDYYLFENFPNGVNMHEIVNIISKDPLKTSSFCNEKIVSFIIASIECNYKDSIIFDAVFCIFKFSGINHSYNKILVKNGAINKLMMTLDQKKSNICDLAI